jgi:hypothetical protein
MNVWRMNLLDNRDEPNRDIKAKFNTCKKNSFVAIGWAIEGVSSWEEYKLLAGKKHQKKNFSGAINGLERIQRGDLVWVMNPESKERYIVEIEDETPSVCNGYEDFDICAYRKGTYYKVDESKVKGNGVLTINNIKALKTIECKSDAIKEETVKLFKDLKKKNN